MKDIPSDYKLTAVQKIQQTCEINNEPFINKPVIREFIKSLQYPLYYMDFETFNPGIPTYNGTHPYQKVPFQFSLHVVSSLGAKPEHYGFLGDGTEDPRLAFLTELKKVIGEYGNIIVYNQTFEKGVLAELGEALPEYADWVEQTSKRVVDLYAPCRYPRA